MAQQQAQIAAQVQYTTELHVSLIFSFRFLLFKPRLHVNADPDFAFYLYEDPDPAFHFNADPDPAALKSDRNLRSLVNINAPGLHF